jgi:pilus assembly protein CpaB
LIVVVALVLGVVAGASAYFYLHSLQAKAYHNAKLTTVYQVTGIVPKGEAAQTAVSQGLIKRTQIPNQFRPSDAITDLAAVNGDVAIVNISPGQVLVSGLFVAPQTVASTASQSIPKGDVAISVSLGTTQAVAGLVQPGDKVDLLVQVQPLNAKFQPVGKPQVQYLYQNVQVLAVGAVLSSQSSLTAAGTANTVPPGSSSLYTFVVPPDAAARIVSASVGSGGASSLYMALVPPNNTPVRVAPITPANLIPTSLTPK